MNKSVTLGCFEKELASKIFLLTLYAKECIWTYKAMTQPYQIFKALGDETRLRLVNLFLQTTEDLCVCEMVDALKLPQYQISKHLMLLKNAGLLQATREGTWVYYRLDREESPLLRDLFKVLHRHLKQQTFNADAAQLARRLALREAGRCVVGFVSAATLGRHFQNKKTVVH